MAECIRGLWQWIRTWTKTVVAEEHEMGKLSVALNTICGGWVGAMYNLQIDGGDNKSLTSSLYLYAGTAYTAMVAMNLVAMHSGKDGLRVLYEISILSGLLVLAVMMVGKFGWVQACGYGVAPSIIIIVCLLVITKIGVARVAHYRAV